MNVIYPIDSAATSTKISLTTLSAVKKVHCMFSSPLDGTSKAHGASRMSIEASERIQAQASLHGKAR